MTLKLASSLALALLAGILPLQAADTIAVPRAELEQIHQDFQAAKTELAKRDKDLGTVQTALATAFQQTIPNLQQAVQTVANQRADALLQVEKDKETIASKNWVIKWLSFPPAVLAGVLVLWACLKFGLPNLSPPWGMAATVCLPLAAFGGVMALMRFV